MSRVLVLVAVAVAYFPYFTRLFGAESGLGVGDWDLAAAWAEILRQSVFEYGEFPWWNPYASGGFPYYANPISFGPFSILTPLLGALGVVRGLHASVLVHMVIGFWGMSRLAGRFSSDRFHQSVAAMLFVCNGGILIHLAIGHHFYDYFYFPWVLYFFWSLVDSVRKKDGQGSWKSAVALGLTLALQLHALLHYGVVFTVYFVIGLSLWQLRVQKARRAPLLAYLGLAALIFVSLAAFKLQLAAGLRLDYPRSGRFSIIVEPLRYLRVFLAPGLGLNFDSQSLLSYRATWHELGCYLGVFAVGLFSYSAVRRRRWVHALVGIGLILMISAAAYSPFGILNRSFPGWDPIRIVARLRIWLIPFFALGVVIALRRIQFKHPRLAVVLAALTTLDVTANGAWISSTGFRDWKDVPHPPSLEARSTSIPVTLRFSRFEVYRHSMYDAARYRYSLYPGYEPSILLPDDQDTPHRGSQHAGYRGEAWTDEGPVTPIAWTPQRWVFEGVKGPLHLNVSPGSYWRVNGVQAFPGTRVVEPTREFIVSPDAQGRAVIEARPPGLEGIVLRSVLLMFLAVAVALWARLHSVNRCQRSKSSYKAVSA